MGLMLRLKYFVNDRYNARYLKKLNIVDNTPVAVSDFTNTQNSKDHACPYMCVWLLNIDRIVAASGVSPRDYDFLDVGCGKAVSTIYVSAQYQFRSVSGFDFEPKLLEIARNNIKNSVITSKFSVFQADASELVLERKKWFLFIFNSFDAVVMDNFLTNNVEMLRETGSVLGYANAREMETLRMYSPKRIIEIESYRCGVVFF